MTAVCDHIRQVRYLLQQMLESGLLSGRGFDDELKACSLAAQAMGLDTGAQLVSKLSAMLFALRAGQGNFSDAAQVYSDITAYYDFVAKKVVAESITT